MQLVEKMWFRVSAVAVPAVALAFWLGTTDYQRSVLGLKLAGLIGYCLPAVALGAAVGWLTYSRFWWGNVTLLGVSASVMAYLLHAG
jgi:hypothetical protein